MKSKRKVYYNEFDSRAAEWILYLMREGNIPQGDVDKRSIIDVKASDLEGYTQCHFFAGIAGWPRALDLANWPKDREIWSASLPCQPFSGMGLQKAEADERHLFPVFLNLVAQRKPATIIGEQVASPLGRAWLVGIRADLENLRYAFGAADLCAASVGQKDHSTIKYSQEIFREMARNAERSGDQQQASEFRDFADYLDGVIVGTPHIRQRLWWVASSERPDCRMDDSAFGRNRTFHRQCEQSTGSQESPRRSVLSGDSRVGVAIGERLEGLAGDGNVRDKSRWLDEDATGSASETSNACGLPDPASIELQEFPPAGNERADRNDESIFRSENFWGECNFIPCLDGKVRRIEPESSPLVDGIPHRVGLLRGYGNAIVAPLAAEFIKAYLETESELE